MVHMIWNIGTYGPFIAFWHLRAFLQTFEFNSQWNSIWGRLKWIFQLLSRDFSGFSFDCLCINATDIQIYPTFLISKKVYGVYLVTLAVYSKVAILQIVIDSSQSLRQSHSKFMLDWFPSCWSVFTMLGIMNAALHSCSFDWLEVYGGFKVNLMLWTWLK